MKGFDLVKQAKKMAEQMEQAKADLAKKTVEASVGGGMVKVVANGENQILKIEIARDVINPEDKEMLEDLVVSAVNEALRRVQELVTQSMSSVTGGFNIPGLF